MRLDCSMTEFVGYRYSFEADFVPPATDRDFDIKVFK